MRIYRESTLHVQCTYLEHGMSMCFCQSRVERDRWTMRVYRARCVSTGAEWRGIDGPCVYTELDVFLPEPSGEG